MDTIRDMTVEQLDAVVQSQLCVHGNKALFVRGMQNHESFHLVVGNTSILDCVAYDESDEQEFGLGNLARRLEGLDETGEILCSSERHQVNGFQIGFRSEYDGFVETINATELLKGTKLDEK